MRIDNIGTSAVVVVVTQLHGWCMMTRGQDSEEFAHLSNVEAHQTVAASTVMSAGLQMTGAALQSGEVKDQVKSLLGETAADGGVDVDFLLYGKATLDCVDSG